MNDMNQSRTRSEITMLGTCLMLVISGISAAEKSLEPNIETDLETLSALQKKGNGFQDEAKNLKENQDEASIAKIKELEAKAKAAFVEAARGYEKLAIQKLANQHPADPRAGMVFLSAGMNYMRAAEWNKAIEVFDTIARLDQMQDDLRAQTMYWKAFALEKQGGEDAISESFGAYRRVAFEFPESKWAKFARGRLADERYKDLRGEIEPPR
ncbi:MAG TPA: hypothetical protein VFY13_05595 [Luteolibacter sp.]|nr:hypothetical protein [Luteolibacter sp.]